VRQQLCNNQVLPWSKPLRWLDYVNLLLAGVYAGVALGLRAAGRGCAC
jgi:hypothetical protein